MEEFKNNLVKSIMNVLSRYSHTDEEFSLLIGTDKETIPRLRSGDISGIELSSLISLGEKIGIEILVKEPPPSRNGEKYDADIAIQPIGDTTVSDIIKNIGTVKNSFNSMGLIQISEVASPRDYVKLSIVVENAIGKEIEEIIDSIIIDLLIASGLYGKAIPGSIGISPHQGDFPLQRIDFSWENH